MKLLFLLASIFSIYSFEEFLTPLDKTGIEHFQIKNIDFIYVINLDRRPERWIRSQKALNAYGINPYRLLAYDGKKLTKEMIHALCVPLNDEQIKWLNPSIYLEKTHKLVKYKQLKESNILVNRSEAIFTNQNSLGAMGCTYSHLAILKDAIDSNYENILVLEDDFIIKKDPHLISDLIDEANQEIGYGNWDILFLDNWHEIKAGNYPVLKRYTYSYPNFDPMDRNIMAYSIPRSTSLNSILARFGTYSMVISKIGAKKIFSQFQKNKVFHPIDVELFKINILNMFEVKEHYIKVDDSTSDTKN